MIRKRWILLVVTALMFGCGEKGSSDGNVKNNVGLSICGVTHYDSSIPEFRFNCGLSAGDLDLIDDLSGVHLKKEQICDVYYADNGQPEIFICKDKPESIDTFIARGAALEGDWTCTGLDSFGGDNSKNESGLSLHSNGKFEVLLRSKEKTGTDSIWFLSDSVISGHYESNDENKLVLTPDSWTSELISKTGLTIKDAPKFMLVKPLTVEIKNLTNDALKGTSWRDNPNSNSVDIHSVECQRG